MIFPPPVPILFAPSTNMRTSVQLEHAVRTGAYDILFDGDSEGDSIPGAVAAVLASLPVDLRAHLAARILVVGGTSLAPGFLHRFGV
jgi:hypothetical protein